MVIPATRAVRPVGFRVRRGRRTGDPAGPGRGAQRGRVARRWATWLRICAILAFPSGLRT